MRPYCIALGNSTPMLHGDLNGKEIPLPKEGMYVYVADSFAVQ